VTRCVFWLNDRDAVVYTIDVAPIEGNVVQLEEGRWRVTGERTEDVPGRLLREYDVVPARDGDGEPVDLVRRLG
jgi:hypothetical protein